MVFKKGFDKTKKFMMSEEAFSELINRFEYVGNLTECGKENIKYHVQILQQKNKKLEQALSEIEEYIEEHKVKHYKLINMPDGIDIILLENEIDSLLEIIQKARGDVKNEI
jgi:ketopantoate reductase